MNKKKYIILAGVVLIVLSFLIENINNNQEVELQNNEAIIYSIKKDLVEDGNAEKIFITRIPVSNSINKDKLYIENKKNNPSFDLVGFYSNLKFEDINQDKNEELIIQSISGQLATIQIFQYIKGNILPIEFFDQDKKSIIWSNSLPSIVDLDSDGLKEIVFTHILQGEIPTETIEIKDFYRLSSDKYQKYKQEKNILGSNFSG